MSMSRNGRNKQFAASRLLKDWKELELETDALTTISAQPTLNILEWHCNLCPDYGPYAGTVFHLILRFPSTYPHDPPDVELCTWLSHPNVWDWRTSGYSLCLDMIQAYYTSTPYTGWTSAYSILSLLLQLQSFLFADKIPQDYGGMAKATTSKRKVQRGIQEARTFQCSNIVTHDGRRVTHTHDNPWPPLPKPSSPQPTIRLKKTKSVLPLPWLPSDIHTKIFSFLDPKSMIQAQNVCADWRDIITTYNMFERSQIVCFHTKATVDEGDVVLGVGLKVQYYPGGQSLKSISSPLDILSEKAFDEQNVRTGVWGGHNDKVDFFLPLVVNAAHGERAVKRMENTIFCIFPFCEHSNSLQYLSRPKRGNKNREQRALVRHEKFHPLMAFRLLATLMNSMVVELMDAAEGGGLSNGKGVSRFASEKALEGYCAFHHLLLFFAKRYPILSVFAEEEIRRFLSAYYYRHKRQAPNLGVLLVCLTLSKTCWELLRKPLVMEAFDRNVRWLLQKYPAIAKDRIPPADRLSLTFKGARTSLRLLMFQTYFISHIGRPTGSKGPMEILDRYNKQFGKPTPVQKNDLQRTAKEILDVTTWPEFFRRLGGGQPSAPRLVTILKDAVANSARKKYHDGDRERKLREAREARARAERERLEEAIRELSEREARIGDFWERREQVSRERREAESELQARIQTERATQWEGEFSLFNQDREHEEE